MESLRELLLPMIFSSSGGSSIQYDASVFENIPFEITMPNFVDGVPAGPSVVSMVQDPVKEKYRKLSFLLSEE